MRRPFPRRASAILILAAVTSLVLANLPSAAAAADPPSHSRALKVLTRNLYVGGALERIFEASTPQEAIAAATAIWATVRATDFPERADAIATEIAAHHPHLVGLQEVAIWTSRDLLPTPPDPTLEFDFLQILLDELEARDLEYEVVASVRNFAGEVPVVDPMSPSGLELIGLVDRDVMLARTDLPTHVFNVTNGVGINFEAALSFQSPLGPVVVPRGWVAVDATLRGTTVRVVNTHLERVSPPVQEAQAAELLVGPVDTAVPVMVMGDLNSAAGAGGVPGQSDTSTYDDLIDAGFVDVWSDERRGPGFTCCHAENLRNAVPSLTERIDLVLVRGLWPRSATRLGEQPEDRTPSGLWPSDHAGVAAVVGTVRQAMPDPSAL
jgi:hypothetical protein